MKKMYNVNIAQYLTFWTYAVVKELVILESDEDVHSFLQAYDATTKYYFLWWGANTVFVEDFDGVVVHMAMKGKTVTQENEDEVLLSVAGGEDWIDFVDWTVENGYLWLENLVMIPWSVGAAPVQNIGAYGMEVAERIVSVAWVKLDQTTESLSLSKEECKFSYRDSVFKNELKWRFLITNVVFRLQKKSSNYQFKLNYAGIQQVIEQKGIVLDAISQKDVVLAVKELRASKLPDWETMGTAGSFFENPIVGKEVCEHLQKQYPWLVSYPVAEEGKVKLSAGQLLDFAGLKNYRDGVMGTYEKHALVLVNYGGAKGEDVMRFAKSLQEKVYAMCGVMLEAEVNLI